MGLECRTVVFLLHDAVWCMLCLKCRTEVSLLHNAVWWAWNAGLMSSSCMMMYDVLGMQDWCLPLAWCCMMGLECRTDVFLLHDAVWCRLCLECRTEVSLLHDAVWWAWNAGLRSFSYMMMYDGLGMQDGCLSLTWWCMMGLECRPELFLLHDDV